ncbi:MAG: hypothetical protein HY313_01290 [Acidobacteria bacterium]|nr:hypothetical protein [Acidobacteriota bacterium]
MGRSSLRLPRRPFDYSLGFPLGSARGMARDKAQGRRYGSAVDSFHTT